MTRSKDEQEHHEYLPTTTTLLSRLPHGLPVDRLPPNTAVTTRELNNQWGSVIITGRLFGAHELLRDILFTVGEQVLMVDGCLSILIHKYTLARKMGFRRPSKSDCEWVFSLIEDLRVVQMEVRTPDWVITCGIVTEIRESVRTDAQDRKLLLVVFHREYVRLVRTGLEIYFSEPELDRLAKLPAVARAVVRFMRSHQPGARYRLDTVLRALFSAGGSPSTWSERRRHVREHGEAMHTLGVIMVDDTLIRADPDAS